MKQFLPLFIVLLCMFSCNKNDDNRTVYSDGGQWERQSLSDTLKFLYVEGYEDKVLLVYTQTENDNWLVLKSTDMGQTWTDLGLFFKERIHSIQLFDENVYYMSVGNGDDGQSGFYKTIDGGNNWEVFHHDVIGEQLFFLDEKRAFLFDCCADQHQVSNDGGITWDWFSHFMQERLFNTGVEKVSFPEDKNTGYLQGGWDGLIFKTIDGGYNWSKVHGDTVGNYSFVDMFFVDNEIGYFTYDNILSKTIDGGVNWNKVNESGHISRIWGVGDDVCFALYYDSLCKSADGGVSFLRMKTEEEFFAREFYFASETSAVAVGDFGNVYRLVE